MNGRLQQSNLNAAVVVAHPDDETLWCGGFALQHPDWQWTIVTLCRASDPDRAPRLDGVLHAMQAHGAMADLDDGPDQRRCRLTKPNMRSPVCFRTIGLTWCSPMGRPVNYPEELWDVGSSSGRQHWCWRSEHLEFVLTGPAALG